jgi:hypothetical protein
MKKGRQHKSVLGKMFKLNKYFLWSLIGVFTAVNVYLTVEAATSGAEIAALEKKEAELTYQKSVYNEDLLRTTSLNDLAQKAAGLGFAKPVTIVYLNGEESVAQLPSQDKP